MSWITNSVSKKIGDGTVYFDDARLLWLNLKERFKQSNMSKSIVSKINWIVYIKDLWILMYITHVLLHYGKN